jgi:hypothetical protein
MFRTTLLLAASLTILGLQGFAQTCPKAPKVRVTKQKTDAVLPAPSPGKAMMVVVRQDDSMYVVLLPLAVDGKWVGANARWTYFFAEVDPGSHVLCTGGKVGRTTFKSAGARLDADEGKTYYFEQQVTWDTGTVSLLPIDDVRAKTIVERSKRSSVTQVY